jgi:mRNA-degrading endonuclease RelE of RelBE toxin-antitoxin system
MAYKLLYTKTAAKEIQKLDTVVRKGLKRKLEAYAKNLRTFYLVCIGGE